MTDPLDEATDWTRTDEHTYESRLAEEWANGPGAYGGIVAASLLRQMQRSLDHDAQVPRTLHVHLPAPLRFEPATLEVRPERRGRSMSHLSARIEQESEVAATASATFAEHRPDAPVHHTLEVPEVPAPEEVEPAPDLPMMPEFSRNFFEMRFCLGDLPLSGSERAESGGWLAFDEPVTDGPLLATCLLDAWPPAIFPTFETFRRAVTVDHRFQFWGAIDREGRTDEPFLVRATSDLVDDGYAQEDVAIWSADGTPVATARQLYAILD